MIATMRAIDLRSDTVTRPGPAMRQAMAAAEVGDDVYGEDPTVNRLEAVAAARFGKQAAVFVPSGTMANQLAIRSHTEPGDGAIAGVGAHLWLYEGGAAAALSGVQIALVGEDGRFGADDVRRAIAPDDPHFPRTRLVCVENTHNRSGGRVFPLETIREIAALARERGLALHLDGARIFNAEAATGIPVAEWAAEFDSVAFCLSKGLGAPVGSLLTGPGDFVRRARRFRKQLGGAMRQAGILAAAGLYALEHHTKRLADDHANARRLAAGLAQLQGVRVPRPPETNMVFFQAPDAARFGARARERGVLIGGIDARTLRAVTHLDVSADDVDEALARLRGVTA
jgi:threonine aldolase